MDEKVKKSGDVESQTKRRAVIVDDDPEVGRILHLLLKPRFETHIALRGDTGLELIREIKPHLAVLDLVLPSIDGMTLCEMIKSDDELKDTQVLIVTATTRHSDLPDTFWKLGTSADGFLSKPFLPEEVQKTIMQMIPQMKS
ncbi:response regulator [Candidatus Sumerlaeota bacterium]|nr:response regulator [Candidatus Sumerlaeota bacterium]